LPAARASHHANLVQERGAVDFLLEIVGLRFLEGRRDGLQSGQMGRERSGAESAVAIVMTRHARLSGRHRVHVPVQIEKRLFDVT
jgi:hypothetical protein